MIKDSGDCVREFLYKDIEDVQGTIRSLDAKAGVGIVILGAMLSQVLDRKELSAILDTGCVSLAAFLVFGALAVTGGLLAMKTIFPMVNPADNVSLDAEARPPFFVSGLRIRRVFRLFSSGSRFATLAETHDDFDAKLRSASPDDIRRVLAAEVLKLSFIRQLKNDRLVAFAWVLVASVVVFVVLTGTLLGTPTTAP